MNAVVKFPVKPWARVDLEHNQIVINNIPIKITAQQAEILCVLCDHMGHPVHEDRIIARVNGSGYWEMSTDSLRAQMTKIRRALEPHAFVDHFDCRGYELRLA